MLWVLAGSALVLVAVLWRLRTGRLWPGRRGRRRWVAVLACAAFGLLSLPFDVWVVQAISCGHQPIETSDFAAAYSYTLPGDGTYTRYPILSGFACRLDEVAGRTHNTLP